MIEEHTNVYECKVNHFVKEYQSIGYIFVCFPRHFPKWKKWPICFFEEKTIKTCLSEFIILYLQSVIH